MYIGVYFRLYIYIYTYIGIYIKLYRYAEESNRKSKWTWEDEMLGKRDMDSFALSASASAGCNKKVVGTRFGSVPE